MNGKVNIVFFGTPELAVWALEELARMNIIPNLIVTSPPAPAGRGRALTEPSVKIWADKHDIKTLQPLRLDENFANLLPRNALFLVFAYGKILPKTVLNIPKYGTLNIHPSLLPKLRGPSPIRTAILKDMKDEIGVSIILLDEKMDHGPIIAQERYTPAKWPVPGAQLDEALSRLGGRLLGEAIPKWINGNIQPQEQNHSSATFTKFFKKEDALIDLKDNDYNNYLKICAYDKWPCAYFIKNGKRIKITSSHMENGKLIINKVIPEGKKEMPFEKIL